MQINSRWLSFAALMLVSAAVFAQVRESISVNIVEVPVTVVDREGNPVRGLTQANFKLLDNGKERPIAAFDTIDFGPAAAPDSKLALAKMNPAARRNFMLLFDLGNSSPRSMSRAQEAARNFVEKAVQPRDLVGVGTMDPDKGFSLVAAFTTDRALIASAIGDPKNFRSHDPLQLSNETKLATLDTSGPMEGGGNGPAAQAKQERELVIAQESKERMNQIQRANQEYIRAKVQKQVEFLGQLAKTLRAVPGRKQIVLLSEGFDASVIAGRDARDTGSARDEQAAIMAGNVSQVDNDARFGNTTSQTFLSRMAEFFRGSDVVLNAIDIQGLRVQNDVQSGARINSNEGLSLLADPTGGMVFQNANDMTANFGRMLKAQEVVYVLAFQAPVTKPGQLHNLNVKLVNAPGGSKAFSRGGYYEGGGETAGERRLTTAEVILNDIPQNDVRLASLAAAFPSAGVNSQVPVILEIDGTDLLKDLKGNTTTAEIYIYAFDSEGTVRDRIYQSINLDLKKVTDRLKAAGIKYWGTLILPPGTYAIKSLVRIPENDRKGFARNDLVIGKNGEPSVMPPIFIDEAPKWLMIKGTSHVTDAANPFSLSGEPFIPAASARVKSGEMKRFAVFVFNAAPNEVTFDTNPKVKFLGAAKNDSGTALVMEMDKVDPNAATLDVTVTAKGSPRKSTVALQ